MTPCGSCLFQVRRKCRGVNLLVYTKPITMKKAIVSISQFAIVNGVNAPFLSKCVEFATLGQSRDALGGTLKAEFATILATTGATEAVAAKQLSASLASALDGVVSSPSKRASEILVALGIRQRAAKTKSEDKDGGKDADLTDIIEALKELAKEQAGEKAISALRRAYLSLQAEGNAAAE